MLPVMAGENGVASVFHAPFAGSKRRIGPAWAPSFHGAMNEVPSPDSPGTVTGRNLAGWPSTGGRARLGVRVVSESR